METLEELVQANPRYKLLSRQRLYETIRDKHADVKIPRKVVDEWYKSREINQLYTPANKTRKNDPLHITAAPFSFQIDVIVLAQYKSSNKGIDRFLLIEDITSRKAFAYPLKSNKMTDVLDAYMQFIQDVDERVVAVTGDDFFNNEMFQTFNDELHIAVHTGIAEEDHATGKGDKLGLVDRLARTLKMMIQKYMLEHQTLKWTEFLDEIVETYNETKHRALHGFSPDEVFDDPDYAATIHDAIKQKNNVVMEKDGIDVGNSVRVQNDRKTFQKERAKYSTMIYKVVGQNGYKYMLEDENGDANPRLYRANELLKVSNVTDRVNTQKKQDAERMHTRVVKLRRQMPETRYENAEEGIVAESNKQKVKQRGVVRSVDRTTRSGRVS